MLYDAVNCTFEIQLYGLIITFVNYKLVYNDVQKLFEKNVKVLKFKFWDQKLVKREFRQKLSWGK